MMHEPDFLGERAVDVEFNASDRYARSQKGKLKRVQIIQRQKARKPVKRFVAWDGEGSSVPNGTPQPYMLFGNSEGEYVARKQLSTTECLELILNADPEAINFGFAFDYDVNQILWELPYSALSVLARRNRCRWQGYYIEHIPGKWLKVWDQTGRKSRQIYDVFHFFNCSLVAALKEYNIGTPEQIAYIEEQKHNRPDFTWEELDDVIEYWKLEGELMVKLMTYIRGLFEQAGFDLRSWHGPGAVARQLLRSHGVKKAKADLRKEAAEVFIAARYGFCGGRFEQFQAGLHEGPIYNYDIHSAYPYGIQFLPDLSQGKWKRVGNVKRANIRADRFCIYHIRYNADKLEKTCRNRKYKHRPRPLFRRMKNDNVCWHSKVEGWYWSPEAETVVSDPAAEFVEAWEFISPTNNRPLSFIAEMYATREYHKRLGNAIEYPFKLGMNSCYGQFAQRAGWENVRPVKGPPAFHQLEWAGYVTSMCRAMVFKVAEWAYEHDGLITIDTDGIFTTVPVPESLLPNGIGDGLGQWEEKVYDGILIWQNGFYWLKQDGEWKKARSRGAPRGTVPIEKAWAALPELKDIEYEKKVFIGYQLALQRHILHKWRSWEYLPYKVAFGGGGGSKRQHCGIPGRKAGLCGSCAFRNGEGLHELYPIRTAYREYHNMYPYGEWSYMHHLPWLEVDNKAVETLEDPERDFVFGEREL
jgi:DNA polymerase family B